MTIADAIKSHGALAVYRAADDAMTGRGTARLTEMGLPSKTLGDVWRVMREAYEALTDDEKTPYHVPRSCCRELRQHGEQV